MPGWRWWVPDPTPSSTWTGFDMTQTEGIEYDAQEMLKWWDAYMHQCGVATVPKAISYGSEDLKIMGASMASLLRIEGDDQERAIRGQQAAIAFYMLGKIGRIISALRDGTPIPPDHEYDLLVYAAMLRRIRENGSWP
jgi:hypothetical protein